MYQISQNQFKSSQTGSNCYRFKIKTQLNQTPFSVMYSPYKYQLKTGFRTLSTSVQKSRFDYEAIKSKYLSIRFRSILTFVRWDVSGVIFLWARAFYQDINQVLILPGKKSTIKELETHFHGRNLKKEEDEAYLTLLGRLKSTQY